MTTKSFIRCSENGFKVISNPLEPIVSSPFHYLGVSGDYMKTDVCSVHTEKKFLCCFTGLISYGYLGDVIKNSANLRWMGPMRYDCVGKYIFEKMMPCLRRPDEPNYENITNLRVPNLKLVRKILQTHTPIFRELFNFFFIFVICTNSTENV